MVPAKLVGVIVKIAVTLSIWLMVAVPPLKRPVPVKVAEPEIVPTYSVMSAAPVLSDS
jgi:hypothetical protein